MGRLKYLAYKYKARKRYKNKNRDKNTWVFGEWFGDRCCDNSFYLANYISENHPEIKTYWVAKKTADVQSLSNKITVLEMDSEDSENVLKTAGAAFMNQGLRDFSSDGRYFFEGGITVNLWHGIPWKKINFDAAKNKSLAADVHHRILSQIDSAQYFLTPSDEMGIRIQSAFLAGRNRQLLAGYPRNSIFYNENKTLLAKNNILDKVFKKSGLNPKTIIAYMPTFRDNVENVFSFTTLGENARLNSLLQEHDAIIIEKVHFVSSKRGNSVNGSDRILNMNDVIAAELLAAADILITDYSSCFFDYLLLNRPIIHYIYDYDYYISDDRGVYYTKEEAACGKTPENENELLTAITEYLENPSLDMDLRSRQRSKFWQYDRGNACEDIYNAVRKIQMNEK